jgi:hypothetical protein
MASDGPGVWFSVGGTGKTLFLAVNATFESQTLVYTGESCDDLSCVTGDYQSPLQFYDSIVMWESVDGATYYVLVMGFRSSKGDFSLLLVEIDVPDNDNCNDATLIDPIGDAVEGSTIVATLDDDLVYCGTATNNTSAGVWFTFPGTGETLSLGVAGLFDSQLSVYTGARCDALVCVDGNDESQIASLSSSLLVSTVADETYYVLGT